MAIEVGLLGPIQVVSAAGPTHIGSGRQRTLLAALALSPDAVVSVDRLTEVLWGEDPPDNALGNLQTYFSRLRAALGSGTILFRSGGYGLAPGSVTTDVDRVTRLARRARERVESEPAGAASDLGAALAAWRGPTLLDVADNPAFWPDHGRLEELRLVLTDELFAARLACGDALAALPDLEGAAARQPLREATQVLLMRALAGAGRAAEALRVADRYRTRLAEETGLDPGAELRRWERRILDGEAAPVLEGDATRLVSPRAEEGPSPARRRPVTAPPSPGLPRVGRFFGRRRELAELERLLGSGALVTVTGTGGVGKTRLAAELVERWPGPSTVVELAGLDGAALPGALARALGLAVTGAGLDEAIVEYLSVEARLVVLDNCEHVTEAVAALVSRLAVNCPDVVVLATSRVRLGVAGERVMGLQPLPVTGSADDADDAVALFLDRAELATALPPTDPAVQQICRRLDGLPLALELAAQRIEVFGVEGLRDRLDDLLDLLQVPAAGSRRRHATLRAVVEWSYSLLEPEAQRLLDALSVFEGGVDLAAAEALAAAVSVAPAAPVIAALADSSMITTETREPAGRYRLLEMVRQHGRERLVERGLDRSCREAHTRVTVAKVDTLSGAAVGPDEVSAHARLGLERDNVRAALSWLTAHGPTPELELLALRLGELHLYRPDAEVFGWLRSVADAALQGQLGDGRASPTLAAGARAAFLQGDLDEAEELARAGLGGSAAEPMAAHSLGVVALYRGDWAAAASWFGRGADAAGSAHGPRLDGLGGLALAHCYRGDVLAATDAADELVALASLVGSETYSAFAEYVCGEIAALEDDSLAVTHLERAVELSTRSDVAFVTGVASVALIAALIRQKRRDEAAARAGPLLELWRRSGTWTQQWTTLRQVADLLAEDDPATSLLLLEAAGQDHAAAVLAGPDRERVAELRQLLDAALGPGRAERTARMAARLSRAQVLQLAQQSLAGRAFR